MILAYMMDNGRIYVQDKWAGLQGSMGTDPHDIPDWMDDADATNVRRAVAAHDAHIRCPVAVQNVKR